ncbi:22894_t:CDS:2, partial [Gigaspora rosea]
MYSDCPTVNKSENYTPIEFQNAPGTVSNCREIQTFGFDHRGRGGSYQFVASHYIVKEIVQGTHITYAVKKLNCPDVDQWANRIRRVVLQHHYTTSTRLYQLFPTYSGLPEYSACHPLDFKLNWGVELMRVGKKMADHIYHFESEAVTNLMF